MILENEDVRKWLTIIRFTVKECLEKQGITRYELAKRTGLMFQVVDNYYKNKVVRYDSYILNKFCDALNCDVSDLIEYKK